MLIGWIFGVHRLGLLFFLRYKIPLLFVAVVVIIFLVLNKITGSTVSQG